VRDESGFAAMLGLKRGDRIAQANGIALTAPEMSSARSCVRWHRTSPCV